MKEFHITRVVTRDFVRDWFQGLRSMFGFRMKAYEERVKESIDEVMLEVKEKGEIKWFRMNQDIIDDGILITIYGEYK